MATDDQQGAYQVLARKYRPQDFDALIGQEAMVRVLRNAFASGRIHHAYVLTGVRGVGKTTTARIIAKGLNCIGEDGQGGPTVEPCGTCENCTAIAEGRHVDVIELDAASHTGIDDIREIIEGAKYRPAIGRYKVYIIDETHMLSKNAFNGLLKTLEEPPAHVKFLFATTEIRKMPVTVLSRCQRFDLRRVEPDRLVAHLASVVEAEGVTIDAEALALIARAAEGSVRDALSLLDQAIADGGSDAAAIRSMLGLADRGRVIDLFAMIMRGEAAAALAELRDQYRSGADPEVTLNDLAETAHWLSTLKVAPDIADDPSLPAETRARGKELAEQLPMRVLARSWQMLLKALEETRAAPSPLMAAEMSVIRLCAVSDLPTPDDLIRKLESGDHAPAATPPAPKGGGGGATARAPMQAVASQPVSAPVSPPLRVATSSAQPKATPDPAPHAETADLPQDFDAVVALISKKRDGILHTNVRSFVRLISYKPGRIEFRPANGAPEDLAGTLATKLNAWTDTRWIVSIGDKDGLPTLAETEASAAASLDMRVRRHPLVAAGLAAFPDAEIRSIPLTVSATTPDMPEEFDDLEDDEDDDGMDLLGEN